MRKDPFVEGEFYHVYNRGVEKRNVIQDRNDLDRFFLSMEEFNTEKPIGSIHEHTFLKKGKTNQLGRETSKLVILVAYCLNPNHFHFIIQQNIDGGISEFMKRLSGGYTKYFNQKNKRSGVLFQGVFQSKLINSNEYLLHLSAYVNLNNRLHGKPTQLSKSSWEEYTEEISDKICKIDIVLDQFKNKKEYNGFALETLENIKISKAESKELEKFLFNEAD